MIERFLPPANEIWGKVIFSEASVSDSVHRGGGESLLVIDSTLPGQHHPPQQHHPLGQKHPLDSTTLPSRSTSELYASCWNAFLLIKLSLSLLSGMPDLCYNALGRPGAEERQFYQSP